MGKMQRIRWSDTDRYFGPFTYAREASRGYRPFALVLGSGDGDDHPGCRFRMSAFGRTLIIALPGIIRPWRTKVCATSWDAATVERLGRDWYYDTHEREYGVSLSEGGFFQVFLGRQTHDSRTEQRWSKFLPWVQWRHVRTSLYGLTGERFYDEPKGYAARLDGSYQTVRAMQDACPSATFAFADFDGERLTATTRIKEWEWRLGEGWFKWLSFFRSPKIRRSLDIAFSGETGKRKGSWKGGTTGHSIDMVPGELHAAAFRRYCAEHGMTFVDPRP